jgi:hypothetical protein
MEKPIVKNGTLNGHSNGFKEDDKIEIGQKSKIETATDNVKSALTNGLNSLKPSN